MSISCLSIGVQDGGQGGGQKILQKTMEIRANTRKIQENLDRLINKSVKFRLFHYNPPNEFRQTFTCPPPPGKLYIEIIFKTTDQYQL